MGSGPAIVLLHGTLGSWRQVSMLASDLATERTVVLVSRPGYGLTPLATGRSYEDQARAYAALLDRLSISESAILGVSSGAPSAVAFASMYPARCRALLLCGALAPHLASTRGMWATELPGVVWAWVAFERRRQKTALRGAPQLERYLRGQLSDAERDRAGDAETAATLRHFVEMTAVAPLGVEGLLNDIRGIRDAHRRPPPAASNRAPTLVLHGGDDHFVPASHAAFYSSSIPGAVAETFTGGAHLFLQTYRAEAMARIRSFLTEHEPAAGALGG